MKLIALPLLTVFATSAVFGATIDKRVVLKNATAVLYTVSNTAFCLSSGVPDFLIARSQKGIDSGFYVAIPGPINVTDCALPVGILNEAGKQVVATLVDTTDDGTVKLSKTAWDLVAPLGAQAFPATYFVSNAG